MLVAALPLFAAAPLAEPAAVATTSAALPAPAAALENPAVPLRLLPLEITVNGAPVGSWVLLERDGSLYAPADAFEEWRVNRRPTAPPFSHMGQQWYALSSVPGFDAQLDFANQSVDLKFLPQSFSATRLAQPVSERLALTPASLGMFANYDLNYTRSTLRGANSSQDLGALLELGVSNDWGVLTSGYAARSLTSQDPLAPRTVRRLETTFSRDLSNANLTLRVGDSTTRGGSWGRSLYFGGLQIGSNFGLRPGFISQPLPALAGMSSSPSTVELYINDALRQTSQVPTGPFAINNFPLLTGSGQARVVVRDVLGRETVLVEDFFSHQDLLEQGLSDWSAETGAVRRNLGVNNADYGPLFASGLLRHGLSKTLTIETKGELSRSTQGVGLGLVQALPWNLLGQAALAVSADQSSGRGQQWLLGLARSSLHHGFSLRAEGASRGYHQVGQEARSLAYQRQLSGGYTYSSERLGALGVAYARVSSYDQGQLSTYSANYTMRMGERSSLTFNAVHVKSAAGSNSGGSSFGVSLLIPLDRQLALSSNLSNRGGQTDGYVSASQGLSRETGLGWRTLAGQQSGQNYAEGGLYYQGLQGMATADINSSAAQQTVRLGAQGGLVAIDGQVFASRRIQDSFALVEVPGYADVGVGFQGSVLARTNKDGKALVPRLQPYQANSIRLDPSELPISAELDSIEQVVVPGSRRGVIVRFPVRSGRGALIKIIFEDGEPAPAGAEIELVGDKQEFYVARRGEAFITGLQASNQLRLKWNATSCSLAVDLPAAGGPDEIARVGPLTCAGIKR